MNMQITNVLQYIVNVMCDAWTRENMWDLACNNSLAKTCRSTITDDMRNMIHSNLLNHIVQ